MPRCIHAHHHTSDAQYFGRPDGWVCSFPSRQLVDICLSKCPRCQHFEQWDGKEHMDAVYLLLAAIFEDDDLDAPKESASLTDRPQTWTCTPHTEKARDWMKSLGIGE